MDIGFGMSLVLRYMLETAKAVTEALAILNHIPVHMTYNVTMPDITEN